MNKCVRKHNLTLKLSILLSFFLLRFAVVVVLHVMMPHTLLYYWNTKKISLIKTGDPVVYTIIPAINSLPSSSLLLQTVWTQIKADKMSGLIRIQTAWHLKDFFFQKS